MADTRTTLRFPVYLGNTKKYPTMISLVSPDNGGDLWLGVREDNGGSGCYLNRHSARLLAIKLLQLAEGEDE